MVRVDELHEKYACVPRQYIVRLDARVHGLRDTGKLDEFGRWVRVAGRGSYANYDFDVTLKDWVDAQPGRQKPGWVLRPGQFVLDNGVEIQEKLNSKSDLEIRHEGSGRFALYQGQERVEEVFRLPAEAAKKEEVTSTGMPTSNFVSWPRKYCFKIVPVRYCEYFHLGVACKFCNFNAGQDDARSIGLERSTTVNLDETVEAYRINTSEIRPLEGRMDMGGFTKIEKQVRLYCNLVEKLLSATPNQPFITIEGQPMDRKQMLRMRDAGVSALAFEMEIWDPDLFPVVVPGKAQYIGRERYLEAFQEAVDVFGVGTVGCVLVGGLSLIPENGHKTWQESRDSLIEGNTWMIKHGVWPINTNLRLPPGSAYGNDENRMKFPPTEYYIEAAIAHHKAMKEYGLYDRLSKLTWCPLDCFLGGNAGELGAYELPGGLAEWAASVVPREANFFLDWEEKRAKKGGK